MLPLWYQFEVFMPYQNKIEQCLKEIRELESIFREAQDKETLPLSFFNSSIDILDRLKTEIHEIETLQLLSMREQPVNILADTISRKINADFEKSLSLNDRFMFQRDLFQGNADEMHQTFAQLNEFQSLNEAMDFINEKYTIPWESDSGITFKETLNKRFA